MRRPKIVIVGAGPAGGACALALAKHRRAEILLLDKSKYPRVKVCGSGLSPHALKVLDRLGIKERLAPMHLHMAGLTARGPDGGEVHLRGAKGAWVVPRVELDYAIAKAAMDEGVTFREDTKVVALLRDGSGEVKGVKTGSEEIEADLVVCANGSPSRFERDETPRYGIRTIMGWWKGVASPRDDEGIMIWDRRLAGYYAWAFPEPGGVMNIGLTIPEDAAHANRLKDLFREILDDHFASWLRHADQVGKWMGHPATLTTRVGNIAEARALWIGEAARLVSPATVEGISFAMESGHRAAEFIVDSFDAETGLNAAQQARYRASIGLQMLPKFWAAEGFVRLMRSDRMRRASARIMDPQWFARRASALVGEQHP